MTPEVAIWLSLSDPVFIHIGQQVVFAEWCKESGNAASIVWWYWCSACCACSCVRRRRGIILTIQVLLMVSIRNYNGIDTAYAVLGIGSITEVRP